MTGMSDTIYNINGTIIFTSLTLPAALTQCQEHLQQFCPTLLGLSKIQHSQHQIQRDCHHDMDYKLEICFTLPREASWSDVVIECYLLWQPDQGNITGHSVVLIVRVDYTLIGRDLNPMRLRLCKDVMNSS